MATSAFKSTTKRTPIGSNSKPDNSSESSNGKVHRRSRSLSRVSRPAQSADLGAPTPRGRFVNTVRGSGFPEISLDDLAIDLFLDSVSERSGDDRDWGASRRRSEIGSASGGAAAAPPQRRGRSVSRHGSQGGGGGAQLASDANSRRRRSVSVARRQVSDSESDIDHSQSSGNHATTKSLSSGNRQGDPSQKPTLLRRSLSQKDLSKSHNNYSSQSSALTDEETRDAHYGKNGVEKTIRAVYAQKKTDHPTRDDVNSGLYEAMRKELRYAVDEIRTEIEQAMVRKSSGLESDDHLQSGNCDVHQAVSAITENYATKLEQSEKRKQDLLAEILLEEQRGKELSKIVRELLPDSKSSPATAQKPLPARKRSNDRNRMSKRLNEEAERYFEDFISNVEDTDISSFDGERSDASSTLGGIAKPNEVGTHYGEMETYRSPGGYNSLPVEMDGVVLPWLKWETSNDGSSISKNKKQQPVTPKTLLWDAQEVSPLTEPSSHSASSRGSWSPGLVDRRSINTGAASGSEPSHQRSRFDMDKYLKLQKDEDLLFERWRERHRINTGGLLLCSNYL